MGRRRRAPVLDEFVDVLCRRTPTFLLNGRGVAPVPESRARGFTGAFVEGVGHRGRVFAAHAHRRSMDAAAFRRTALAFADLSERNLSGLELQNADLSRAHLTGSDLSGCRMFRANLESAEMRGSRLRQADLRQANLSGARLVGADLREADLRGACLDHADLRGAKFAKTDLRGASLLDCVLDDDADEVGWIIDERTRRG